VSARPLDATIGNSSAAGPGALRALADRYFSHDLEGRTHAENVARLAYRIGVGFRLPRAELLALAVGALLHDVGKLAIPPAVLEKAGGLSELEWDFVRDHPLAGERLVSSHPLPDSVRAIVRWHHERVDGLGYPDGLDGERIPLAVRIVSAADAYEAMVSERPYSPPRTQADALAQLRDHVGTQFDSSCVAMLTRVVALHDAPTVEEALRSRV
jgi:HD-GYP domain-containing protein (c-di-GMP phosphodiesterase class II)